MDELMPDGARDGDQPEDVGPATLMGDADLVAQVRDGQDEPYAELYRRHQPAALALARALTEHTSADDVVSEAFEKLLRRIRGGGGPEAAFRPYLLRTVRTVAVDASRRTRRLVVAEDPEDAAGAQITPRTTEDDELVDAVHEGTTLARAFAALPERWQAFLWLSFVDDADRREIAAILGTNVGSVSALGYRAREGLRRAYLDAHLRDAPTPECAEVWPLLAGAVRGGLSPTQQAEVDDHVAECDHCRAAVAELEAVNTRFGAVLAPIVLGAAAPAYLAALQQGGAPARASAAAAATGAAAEVEAGTAPLFSSQFTGLKATVAGWSKTGTGVAVVACSTVVVVALLAMFSAPLSSELSVSPRPGTSVPDGSAGSRGPGSDGTGEGEVPSGTTEGTPGSTPADPDATTASGDPTTTVGPTTGLPTATTGGPTGLPTATTTGGPTGGPTAGPTSAPTSAGTKSPTPTPSGTRSPTPDGTATTTTPTVTTSEPTPTPSEGPTVDAGLAALVVDSRNQTSFPAHVAIPVSLAGGKADLQVTVTVAGLNKFSTTSGAGEGTWACVALTPMAGADKTAVIRCTLSNAAPGDPLTLGLNLGYAGAGSVSAVLAVLGSAVDVDASDNTASADLPPRPG